MDESVLKEKKTLPKKAKILGTAFLLFQLLFAANNYGPQRIPILKLFFNKPWIGNSASELQQNPQKENSSFKLNGLMYLLALTHVRTILGFLTLKLQDYAKRVPTF